jgi:hypothetical protein
MAGEAVSRNLALGMATDTPTHLQRCDLLDAIHLLNGTVALLASEAGVHVHFVWEVHEVWQVVDFHPLHGFVAIVFFGEPFDVWLIEANDFVTTHASVHGRNSRGMRTTRSGMAILAGNFHLAGVQFVAEWNRLFWSIAWVINGITGSPHPPAERAIWAQTDNA